MNLEEILQYIDQSDYAIDPNLNNRTKENKPKLTDIKDVDYNEIYNFLIRDCSPGGSEQIELNDSTVDDNTSSSDKNEANTQDSSNLYNKENPISGFTSDLPLDNSINSISPDALDNKTSPKSYNDFELSESLNIATDPNVTQFGDLREHNDHCSCDVDTKQLIDSSTSDCGELFGYVKHCVDMQLTEWENKHKLHLIDKLRRYRNKLSNGLNKQDESHTSEDNQPNEEITPYISSKYLKTLGLPSNTLEEDPQSNKTTIKCRHKLSSSLELLKIFDDRFYSIDESSTNRLTKTSTNLLTPTCICTSTDLVLFGTMCGSVFISEFSSYNFERKFCSYNEYEALDSTIDPLNWYEIDSEKGISVTSLDVLPNTGWITVGYNDGTVKLLQNFKVSRAAKTHSGTKTDSQDSKNTDSRTFGLMADAVSSAFSGMKKTNSQTICSTDVFNDSVLNCKFTFSESYEEIICSNLRSIAILTYSKNVLSHNLNVNYLQSLNERLENDQIVDIVCLSSNPQAKFITGGDVGGICAILTLKNCLIFSTRPRLSVLINVNLDKTNRNVTPDLSLVPCVTWMIFNSGKKNIKPILLISLGNQIRFIQCNLQNEKGVLTMNVSNMGTIQFKHTIRSIRIITRLILCIVDSTNVLHIIQINLTSSPMYYDVIRSLDLNEFSNKMELGIDIFDPVWLIQASLLSTITVCSKTVKMMAKGYKKFSNLVSDLFQAKKHTSSFELKNFTILILVPNGVLGIEINSWIKVIGELSASKLFCEALSIIQALSEEWIPGLYDFRAFKNNLSHLILYILHQSSAHIIKLSKFVNETQNISTNLLNLDSEAPKDDFWNSKIKSDVYDQINTLCCSMIDSCVSSKMYEPLNDLIFRCFATINLENVFVKHILVNFHHGRINLQFLNSQIIESICNTYELVLDDMYGHFLDDQWQVEDEILYINQNVSMNSLNVIVSEVENSEMRLVIKQSDNEKMCRHIMSFTDNLDSNHSDYLFNSFNFDPRILVYHIICNSLCKIQLYCFKNNVITQTSKGLSRLSRHFSWHCLIYCNSVVLDDYSNVLDIMISHICNKYSKIQTQLSILTDVRADNFNNGTNVYNSVPDSNKPSDDIADQDELDSDDKNTMDYDGIEASTPPSHELQGSKSIIDHMGNTQNVKEQHGKKYQSILPLSVSENLFAVRVLFLTLESFITFENCGLTDHVDISSYCNLVRYLCSTPSFKPSFPIESKPIYTRESVSHDATCFEDNTIESQQFPHDFKHAELTPIYKLLKISPRLFFVCVSNLFMHCSDKFNIHSNSIGTKTSSFNFLMNVIVSSLYKLKESLDSHSIRVIKNMLSYLFLRVSSGAADLCINLNTAMVAIHALLTEKEFEKDLKTKYILDTDYSRELIDHEGYFNNTYFFNVFYTNDHEFHQDCVMILNLKCVEKAIYSYIRNYIYSICFKLKCVSELGQNKHFVQLSNMCKNFINLTSTNLRFFFYQITGDFEAIIGEYESFNREENVFTYLDKCIEYISLNSKTIPETVDHLLLMDSTIRKNFVRAILKNLQKLIKLDLSKVTNLLIQLFSLMDVIKTLDSTLEMSPETMLNTLKTLPDLQILVLDALLKSKSNTGNMLQLPNSYFNRYLNLLSVHDKPNVANFLKRQKSLNITYCLNICRQNNIDDAIIYLLLRAGNLEEAVQLLLVSFSNNINDLETCSNLLKTAHNICQDYHNQISYEIIEKMWFTMLKLSIECLNSHMTLQNGPCELYDRVLKTNNPSDAKHNSTKHSHVEMEQGVDAPSDSQYLNDFRMLVVEIFNVGILKYVKFPNALTEIIKYEASLSVFKNPLHNLLSDFQLQTYIANSASTISKIIMNKEFRQRQVFNNRGVVISTINRNANINRNLICPVCNKNLIYNIHFDAESMLEPEKHIRKPKAQFSEDYKMSLFEEQIGVLSNVPIQGDKSNTTVPTESSSIINNIYNDRLSTFIIKRHRSMKSFNQPQTLGLYPPIIQTIAKDADSLRRDPIIVYWCRHSFHQHCAPEFCPICNIKE